MESSEVVLVGGPQDGRRINVPNKETFVRLVHEDMGTLLYYRSILVDSAFRFDSMQESEMFVKLAAGYIGDGE